MRRPALRRQEIADIAPGASLTLNLMRLRTFIAATVVGAIGPWGWIGVVPLATGVFRFCPAYLPFGLNSCGLKGGKR